MGQAAANKEEEGFQLVQKDYKNYDETTTASSHFIFQKIHTHHMMDDASSYRIHNTPPFRHIIVLWQRCGSNTAHMHTLSVHTAHYLPSLCKVKLRKVSVCRLRLLFHNNEALVHGRYSELLAHNPNTAEVNHSSHLIPTPSIGAKERLHKVPA